jgi:hypothetical protein
VKDAWEILEEARDAGWIDEGWCEPLADTVARAAKWLEERPRLPEDDDSPDADYRDDGSHGLTTEERNAGDPMMSARLR